MKRRHFLRATVGTTCCSLVVPSIACSARAAELAAKKSFLFVSLLEKRQIQTWLRDSTSGRLTHVETTDCPAEPANTLGSSDGRNLFVSFRSTGRLGSYSIDASTGKLTLLNDVEGGEDPAYLLLDRTGQFLFTAYYVSNKVTVHAVLPNGSLMKRPVDSHETAANAHGVCIDSSSTFVRVSHNGANRIDVFRFDSQQGLLTPLDPPFVTALAGQNPRHIVQHPSDRWVYCSNEAGSSSEDGASVYACDELTGQLKMIQSIRSVPDDFDATQNSTAECLLTPNGKFLYVANRGHNSIAGFAVDQAIGKLNLVSITPTEAIPRSFAISSDNGFLYAAGEASGKVACYRIESDGRLTRIDTVDSGPVSWCITSVDVRD